MDEARRHYVNCAEGRVCVKKSRAPRLMVLRELIKRADVGAPEMQQLALNAIENIDELTSTRECD
jgi:hypothetical protein